MFWFEAWLEFHPWPAADIEPFKSKSRLLLVIPLTLLVQVRISDQDQVMMIWEASKPGPSCRESVNLDTFFSMMKYYTWYYG